MQDVISNMSIKAEIIRQAKKYLENKNLSIKVVKPRLFAKVSQELNKDFDSVLYELQKRINNGTSDKNN